MDQEFLKNLYETREFADCSFIFPKEDKKVIKAHVVVLAYGSPVFRSMFESLKKEKSNEGCIKIEVTDVESGTFEELLRFIYCREPLIIQYIIDLTRLYTAFDKYECIDGKNFIIQKLNENKYNSATSRCLLMRAKQLNDQPLFDICVEKLFKSKTYDPEVIKIYPQLFKEAILCYLNKKEENDQLQSQKVLSIVTNYMAINEDRYKNLNKKLQPLFDSIKWDLVPLKQITECCILSNKQKVEYIKNYLEVNQPQILEEKTKKKFIFGIQPKNSIAPEKKAENRETLMNEVATSIGQHYIEQKHTDCKFVFSNGENLKAHKLVLCFSSPVFEAMFYGTVGQKNPVEIQDSEKLVFDLLLKILYLLDVDLSSESSETLADLYAAAHKYQCIAALNTIREYISVRSEDAFLFYDLSETYDDEELKKTCLKHLENPLKALKTNHFLNADPETVCLVYKANKVDGSGMIGLVKGLELYIEKNKEEQPKILFEVKEALKGIRFHDLSTLEILQTSLLSDREKLIFFAIKENYKTNVAPPKCFEIENFSISDFRFIRKNMNSDFSSWSVELIFGGR